MFNKLMLNYALVKHIKNVNFERKLNFLKCYKIKC